jgi:hypothetical protein
MVWTTECMISMIYVVVNINKYWIKLSLTNNVVSVGVGVGIGVGVGVSISVSVGVGVGVGIGGVVIGGVILGGGGSLATAVDVSTGAAVAANNNNAVGTVVPPSSTNGEDAYVGASVAFEGGCVGAFADGAGESTAASALLPPRCRRRAVRHCRTSRCRHRHCR